MGEPIEFYFDFASPYGFLAAMQIDAVAQDAGRAVTWRPLLLGAIYKKFGQSPLDHPLKRDYVIRTDAPRMARALGLAMKVPAGFPEHSLPPTRAFYWIESFDPAAARAFAKAAYRTYWLEGRSTSDPGVASDAAAALGLERDAVLAGMNDPAIKARAIGEAEAAIRKGVFGSPFILVDGEPFWGSDRLDQLRLRLTGAPPA